MQVLHHKIEEFLLNLIYFTESTCTTHESSYKVTEETIKFWLRYAIDRDSGRNRRKVMQNNNNIDESLSENDSN